MIYGGSQAAEDVVFRTLLFRFFNKPETWLALEHGRGELTAADFDPAAYAEILDRQMAAGRTIYSAAYIVPPPPFGHARKHRNHLALIEHMMSNNVASLVTDAISLEQIFRTFASFPSLGPFLAYQLTIDLNYSSIIDFDEDEFVVAGPGAASGLAKCFPGAHDVSAADLIRWMVDTQSDQIAHYGVQFQDLFGRPLKLIDCQNLFCETDKYARVAHPTVRGVGNRTRIKQQFAAKGPLDAPFFPPKWRLCPISAEPGMPLVAVG